LSDEKAQLDQRLDLIGRLLTTLGERSSSPATRSRPKQTGRATSGRRRRGGSLKEHIVRSLRKVGAPQSVKQIGDLVKREGYQTSSRDLSRAVSNVISALPGVVRVDRGLYRAK
jgi:hypothetical protein